MERNSIDHDHKNSLKLHFKVINTTRAFFLKKNFLDVLTPPIVDNPGMEVHIHPFAVTSIKDQQTYKKYLHTSPEFHMKEILSYGFEKIFTLSYCFRDEPISKIHRQQFVMLEWYRLNENYDVIMDDCVELVLDVYLNLKKQPINLIDYNILQKPIKKTVNEIFLEFVDIVILQYTEFLDIQNLVKKKFPELYVDDKNMQWDDYFFLIFLNKIEKPMLEKYPFLILYEFPYKLAALSTLKKDDSRVAERFEIYLNGIELCNCFNELTDVKIQRKRFQEQKLIKKKIYDYELPEPDVLYSSLERGIASASGVALGVERLLIALTNCKNPFWN